MRLSTCPLHWNLQKKNLLFRNSLCSPSYNWLFNQRNSAAHISCRRQDPCRATGNSNRSCRTYGHGRQLPSASRSSSSALRSRDNLLSIVKKFGLFASEQRWMSGTELLDLMRDRAEIQLVDIDTELSSSKDGKKPSGTGGATTNQQKSCNCVYDKLRIREPRAGHEGGK